MKTNREMTRNGFSIETFSDQLSNGKTLHISTCKGSRGITTSCTAVKIGEGVYTWIMFQDFSKTIMTAKGRATQKAIEEQHAKALEEIDSLMAEAEAFYSKKAA